MSEEASVPQTIGRNVTRLREAKGWSQAQLAVRLTAQLGKPPWSRQAMNMGERGRRQWTSTEIAAVARLFGVTPGSLFEVSECLTCGGNPPAGFTCKRCGADA